MQEACKAASIEPTVSFHILRHSYASHPVMRGTPLMVVGTNLGHADTRMVERHYGHMAPSYVAETIRPNMPALGILEPTNVHVIATGKRVAKLTQSA
jgi:site-specific recombinase XerD